MDENDIIYPWIEKLYLDSFQFGKKERTKQNLLDQQELVSPSEQQQLQQMNRYVDVNKQSLKEQTNNKKILRIDRYKWTLLSKQFIQNFDNNRYENRIDNIQHDLGSNDLYWIFLRMNRDKIYDLQIPLYIQYRLEMNLNQVVEQIKK